MFVRAMETCWPQVVKTAECTYSTKESRGWYKSSRNPTPVNSFISLKKEFLMSILLFIDWINCVRWSPSGNMLATASWDLTARVLDSKTGKVLYSGDSADGSKFLLLYL